MRVIPVIDLMQGQVVRGIAGRRTEYRPIKSQIASDAQAGTVARAFASQFGFEEVYVADLDAIVHGNPNLDAWQQIGAAGLTLWLDAGVGTPQRFVALLEDVHHALASPTIVIGLESVPAPLCVVDIVRYAALSTCGVQLAFSLDLQGGQPLTNVAMWKNEPPINIVRSIVRAGIPRLIVLDLADVGVGRGTGTLELCRQIRHECPELELIAGGGVRGVDDLKALADAGCSAALVASSLHDGRLSAEDVRRVMQS